MKPVQLEVTWQDEAFTLEVNRTQDGERVARERAQRETDRAEAEGNQQQIQTE